MMGVLENLWKKGNNSIQKNRIIKVNSSDDPMITEQFDPQQLGNEEDSPSNFDKLYLELPYDDPKVMAQFDPEDSDNEE